MDALKRACMRLPEDHPAKLAYVSYPVAGRISNSLAFVNCPRSLRAMIELCFKRVDPKLPFIIYENEKHSYGEVWKRVSALASALKNDLNVGVGDRVCISMRNYPEWCLTFLAAACAGAIVVPLNSWWKHEEMAYGLKDSGTKVLFCDAERLAYASAALAELRIPAVVVRANAHDKESKTAGTVSAATKAGAKVLAFEEVEGRRAGEAMPPAPTGDVRGSTAAIFYTSGTTGNPKGVCQSHRGVVNQLWVSDVLVALGLSEKPTVQDCTICPVPLFHVTGSHHIFLTALVQGKRLALMKKWDPLVALQLIDREKPTRWLGVPTMIQDIMEHPRYTDFDTSSLKVLGGGGAPTPTTQITKVQKKFKAGVAGQGYGLTETNGGISSIDGEEYAKRPGSCGQAQPHTDVIVVDENSPAESIRILTEPGLRGELLIRGPLVMTGYWNKPEKTAAALVSVPGKGSGWFRTGDIAKLDADGFIYIVDRKKDIIIRGGENISCAEVESAFYENPAVLECACFGLKDARLGERVGLCISLKSGAKATAAEMVSSVARGGSLAKFKIPLASDVFLIRHQLPRGATGKILKRAIRDKYNEVAKGRAKL